jgi:hypothetical protein
MANETNTTRVAFEVANGNVTTQTTSDKTVTSPTTPAPVTPVQAPVTPTPVTTAPVTPVQATATPTLNIVDASTYANSPIPHPVDAFSTVSSNMSRVEGGLTSFRENLRQNPSEVSRLNGNPVLGTPTTYTAMRASSMLVDADAGKVYIQANIPRADVDRTLRRNSEGMLEFKGSTVMVDGFPAGSVSYNPNAEGNSPAISMNPDGSASVRYVYDINDATKVAGFLEASFTNVRTQNPTSTATGSETTPAAPAATTPTTVTTTGSLRVDFGTNAPIKLTGSLSVTDNTGNTARIGGEVSATTTQIPVSNSAIAQIGLVNVATTNDINIRTQSPNAGQETAPALRP